MEKDISIIIPAYNEEKYIETILKDIAMQDFELDRVEVVVVDNSSSDGTAIKVREFSSTTPQLEIKLLNEINPNVCSARNKGAANSSGKVLVFLDADNTISRSFLKEVYEKAFLQGFEAATIRMLTNECSLKGRALFFILEKIKLTIGRPFGKSFCSRKIFSAVNGYNESVTLGTNLDFLIRVKKQLSKNGKKMGHILKPIYTSLRRFEKCGYVSTLVRWFLAYAGFRKVSYSREYNKQSHYLKVNEGYYKKTIFSSNRIAVD